MECLYQWCVCGLLEIYLKLPISIWGIHRHSSSFADLSRHAFLKFVFKNSSVLYFLVFIDYLRKATIMSTFLEVINYGNLVLLWTVAPDPQFWNTRIQRGVECEPPHFLVRATFLILSRPSHIKMLVLQYFFFKCALICRLKNIFKKSGHVRA